MGMYLLLNSRSTGGIIQAAMRGESEAVFGWLIGRPEGRGSVERLIKVSRRKETRLELRQEQRCPSEIAARHWPHKTLTKSGTSTKAQADWH